MTASHQREQLNRIWAKSPERGAGGKPETLVQHTRSVLERLTEFIRLRPHLPNDLGLPRLWHILFWAAFLHDWGKAAKGFQAALRPGGEKWPHRHEVLSLAFADWVTEGLKPEEQAWLIAAIVSHHKDAAEIGELYPLPDDNDDDQLVGLVAELDEATLGELWDWIDEDAAAWIAELKMDSLNVCRPNLPDREKAIAGVKENGAERIRHWLGVYRRFVQAIRRSEERALIVGTLTLRGYLLSADHGASAHAGHLPKAQFDVDNIPSNLTLYHHQTTAKETDGSALLTAPTGSGKTEAALLWAARQAGRPSGLPRLFYTLPYQASMNAMKLRLEKIFGEGRVGLQHGRSLLALYRQLLDRNYNPQDAAAQARQMRDLVKLNHPPVRVFSPYQMLKAMYRLKGYEAILSDYYGAAFVFDEIHAYEVKRLALILKTVEYLAKNFDARFLFMSATFPSLVKEWLRLALGDHLVEIQAEPSLFDAFRRHRLILLDGELLSEEGLRRIVQDARSGRAVLVACNLVRRAQEAYRQLSEQLRGNGVHVELLHGLFNQRDRLAKEKLVRDAVGLDSQDRRPIVLVATQVVEVSLNIDLDTLYSEPAPLEALVQRFGRVNRLHKQTGLAPVHVFRLPDDGQKIYDPELVARTLGILERKTRSLPTASRAEGWPVDERSIGSWLDEIYSDQVAARWREEYDHAACEFEKACIRPLRAFESDSGLEDLFYRAFDGIEVLPEGLYDEYVKLAEQEPIRASELLVPISWGRYCALLEQGRVLPAEKDMPRVVRANYNAEVGLTFASNEDAD